MYKNDLLESDLIKESDKPKVASILYPNKDQMDLKNDEENGIYVNYLDLSDDDDSIGNGICFDVSKREKKMRIREECGEFEFFNEKEGRIQVWLQFVLMFETDYVDDGLTALLAIWISLVLSLYVKEYAKVGIKINQSKSTVIMNTEDIEIKQEVAAIVKKEGLKVDYEGNVKYLGVAHGTDEYCNDYVTKKLDKLDIKMNHIKLFHNDYIRMNMLTKLYGYNRINYMLRVQRECGWMERMMKTDRLLNSLIVRKLNYSNLMQYQLPLSSNKGGFGLRPPIIFEHAAKICSFRDKAEEIAPYFLFCSENFKTNGSYNVENMNNEFKQSGVECKEDTRLYDEYLCSSEWSRDSPMLNRLFEREKDKILENEKKHIKKFDEFIQDIGKYVPSMHKNHRSLIDLMDKKYLSELYMKGSKYDRARMKGLSNNGSRAWAQAPYNQILGIEYENSELSILNSLLLGCEIVRNEQDCKMCGQRMDKFGYHALSCPKGGGTHRRHEIIKNVLNKKFNEAGFQTKLEQRYVIGENGHYKRVDGVPGDILVFNWNMEGDENERNMYFDLSVGNIFDSSYINSTSKTRAWLLCKKEREKSKKYGDAPNVQGLALEVTGGMSGNLNKVLQVLAERLENKTNIVKSIQMNRLRSNLLAHMMKQQAHQVLKCYNLLES